MHCVDRKLEIHVIDFVLFCFATFAHNSRALHACLTQSIVSLIRSRDFHRRLLLALPPPLPTPLHRMGLTELFRTERRGQKVQRASSPCCLTAGGVKMPSRECAFFPIPTWWSWRVPLVCGPRREPSRVSMMPPRPHCPAKMEQRPCQAVLQPLWPRPRRPRPQT